jgi:acylphosphatase
MIESIRRQESYRFSVTGRVQGVGYRAATQRKAIFLGLRGWVRNRDDGTVEGQVTGDILADVEAFREWLRKGPPGARVDLLDWAVTLEAFEESTFIVRR